jgi:hypothetical protein
LICGGTGPLLPLPASRQTNLFALQERLGGRAPPLCQFAVPGEQAQISDPIAPKTYPTPESLLGLQPARILVELIDENAPEFFRGAEVAGAGLVLKSVAEDNGALGHTRIYGSPHA